ncbi:MAG: hypothetical protein FJW38_25000 [Acidobacteria bacterium]|nr:hypothetical protein [Acidobacteriota bacterium]
MTRRRHTEQGGYALIFIFALAAMFSLALYVELPRLALEMQRNREEMLVERGEQYARAIKVFVRKNSKYPQTIEELESFNGKRFLRRRYPDPLTGKDEWRLIHVDAGGRYTDSLVQPTAAAGQTGQQGQSVNTFTGGYAPGDQTAQRTPQALQRRQSDQPGAAGQAGAQELQQPQLPVDSSQPGTPPPPPPNQFGPPGVFQPGLQPFPQQPGQFQPAGPQPFPQQPVIGPNGQPIRPIAIPGLPGASPYSMQPSSSQTGGAVPQQVGGGYSFGSGYSGGPTPQQQPQPFNPGAQPQPFQPQRPGPGSGSQSFGNSATPPGLPVNPAAQMIQQLLTTPNPRGLQQAGLQPGSVGLGGGIAGVASKVDAEGIKIYKEKTNYKEWEFVYDPTKDQQRQAGQQQPGMPQPGGMQNRQQGFGPGRTQ